MAQTNYQALWDKAVINPARKTELAELGKKLAANRARYETVSKTTGVPWFFIACIHERESSCDFNTFLGNGEPLNRVTQLVPKGLGPFKSWEEGAIAALKHEGLDKVKAWDLPTLLYRIVAYNGLGYDKRGIPSPYLWSWTSIYQRGKFVADGRFSASTVDPQPGCAALLKSLIAIFPDLLKEYSLMATVTPIAMPVAATSTAGVNVSTSTIINGLLNSFLGMMVTFGGPILSLLQGTTTAHYLAAGATAVVGLGTTVASVSNLINANATASNNTMITISNLTNLAAQALPALQAAAAPAPVAASPSTAAAS